MRKIADRVKRIGLSETYAILDKVKFLKSQGKDIFDLSGGEPDFPTPSHIVNYAISAMKGGVTHYTPSRGDPSLLASLTNKIYEKNHVSVNCTDNIIVTPSAKHALFITLMTLLDPGDEILITTPCWVSYMAMAEMAGAIPIAVPLSPYKNVD